MVTFILIPGAWLGGWAWKKVTPVLQQKGHEVHPITLTGMGERVHLASSELNVETAIQDVLNVIKYNDLQDFVLVGHSFAGKVAAAIADRVPQRVRTILYLDAYRPKKEVRIPQGGFADEWPVDRWKVPFPRDILDSVGKDIQGTDLRWMLSAVTPLPVKYFRNPVTLSENFDSIKNTYIFCTDGGDPVDEILEGKWGRLEGPYKIIGSGHWPMISKPDELAEDMISLSG